VSSGDPFRLTSLVWADLDAMVDETLRRLLLTA
jgi:hypothetical protein